MIGIEVILGIIALVIPATALLLDVRNRKNEDERYRHEQRLQATARLADWARRAAAELSIADHIINCDRGKGEGTFSVGHRIEVGARLSALVDEGRWLFPNYHPESFGTNKAKINRGFRDNRLDGLVSTYRKLMNEQSIDPSAARKDFAYKIQALQIPFSDQVLSKEPETE